MRVLVAFAVDPTVELCGADIANDIGLASGPLYVALHDLARVGWLESRWEDGDPKRLGRARRRFYRVTPEGLEQALAGLLQSHPAFRPRRA
ncbi:MAG TPA: PadR family transcriptional regulator [Phenylobacterium sp.]